MTERPPKYVAYGTAGFRDNADALDVVLYRVGLVAALRSRALKGLSVGVMITASHNPPKDNGAKIVDPYGDMLDSTWEGKVAEVANASSAAECTELLNRLYTDFRVDKSIQANVIYGRDTRESGPRLAGALLNGLDAAKARGTDVGMVTTPQLHYLVRATNTLGGPQNNDRGLESYGVPTTDGYYRKMATALKAVFTPAKVVNSTPVRITVDCANGVGALKLREMESIFKGILDINIVNGEYDKPELLNVECGADYVKTQQRLPRGVSPKEDTIYASFDGDADRVVFYYITNNQFHLLDGDKIATLMAEFLTQLTDSAGKKINIGVVQTAYANGSSSRYVTEELKLPVVVTPTGVKHLHHAAQEFSIGVYFEANGHGTVLFDAETVRELREMDVHAESEKRAIDTLLALSDLINQTVGDAISDMLAVLAILLVKHLTPGQWDAQYSDLPNRLLKAEVRDRTAFVTTDAERRLVEPIGLQDKIDELVKAVKQGRSFVRASGTEDVVRIYAEAANRDLADKLANDVRALVVSQWGP